MQRRKIAQEIEMLKDQDASKAISHLKSRIRILLQDFSSFTLSHDILLKTECN